MPTICRLIQLTSAEGDELLARPDTVPDQAAAATTHSDVYRYWHGIQFLLARHRPDSAAARWLDLGGSIPGADPSLPNDRLIGPADVAALDAVLKDVAPEDLGEHYDAGAMDAAEVYPGTWQAWEEDFDPLGQVLEHYFFLQQFIARCAEAESALWLHFTFLPEGSV